MPPAPVGALRIHALSRDAALVCVAGALRAAAVSTVGIIIALHLTRSGLSASEIGLVIGVGMAGNAAATVLIGLHADQWGQRRSLIGLGLLAGAGYLAIGIAGSLPVFLAVAAMTLVNGMGRDRGPAAALEQALLPATTTDARRTWTMAWYNVVIDAGHALGALGAVAPTLLARTFGLTDAAGSTWTLVGCGVVVMIATTPYALLRPAAERGGSGPVGTPRVEVSADTRGIVRRLMVLFGVDSVGGGFASSALVAYWFFHRHGTSEVQLAWLFFAARILNVLSHLAAAWIARRIGLLNTMVCTHLPSSVFLILVPFAPTAGIAAALFLAREALVEMDVPTRQSYVLAVVPRSARIYASSMTNVTRNAGWAVGPLVGGLAMQHLALAAPLLIGGTMKILYDLALYRSFRHLPPPEEHVASTAGWRRRM
jgi:predicted MFS family arabinose efflux permease